MSRPDVPPIEGSEVVRRRKYLDIVAATEADLNRYGDNHLGVGWTKGAETADCRYQVSLDLIRHDPTGDVTLLDFGCGASHLYEFMLRRGIEGVRYSGLDLSPQFLALSKSKHPDVTYYDLDVFDDRAALPSFDYIVMNGICGYKGGLSFVEMLEYVQDLLVRVWAKAQQGLSFNVMSKHVDWERDDLFHLPIELLAPFLVERLSPHFVVRHDYGLHEYTTYVYREPLGIGP